MARTLCVGVVLYKENSVLLVRHTASARLPTGAYGFPAGRVEPGESLEDAAIRELEEETGLRTSANYLTRLPEKKSTLGMKTGTEQFEFHPFLCTKYSGELRPGAKTTPEFIDIGSLDSILLASDDIPGIARKYFPGSMG